MALGPWMGQSLSDPVNPSPLYEATGVGPWGASSSEFDEMPNDPSSVFQMAGMPLGVNLGRLGLGLGAAASLGALGTGLYGLWAHRGRQTAKQREALQQEQERKHNADQPQTPSTPEPSNQTPAASTKKPWYEEDSYDKEYKDVLKAIGSQENQKQAIKEMYDLVVKMRGKTGSEFTKTWNHEATAIREKYNLSNRGLMGLYALASQIAHAKQPTKESVAKARPLHQGDYLGYSKDGKPQRMDYGAWGAG